MKAHHGHGCVACEYDTDDAAGDSDDADIEARLDRVLDAEMAKRSRESALQTASAGIRQGIRRGTSRSKPRRAVVEEGDESEPGTGGSNGSWSFARYECCWTGERGQRECARMC